MIPDDLLPPCDSDSSDDELGDRVINMNRVNIVYEESESNDSCSGSGEEEDEGEKENEKDESIATSAHSSTVQIKNSASDSNEDVQRYAINCDTNENKNTG